MYRRHRAVLCKPRLWCCHHSSGAVWESSGRPGLSVLTSLLASVDVKIYWTVLRHWSQLVPNMSLHLGTLSITSSSSAAINTSFYSSIVQIKSFLKLTKPFIRSNRTRHWTFADNRFNCTPEPVGVFSTILKNVNNLVFMLCFLFFQQAFLLLPLFCVSNPLVASISSVWFVISSQTAVRGVVYFTHTLKPRATLIFTDCNVFFLCAYSALLYGSHQWIWKVQPQYLHQLSQRHL